MHPNQITERKKQLLERAAEVFEKGKSCEKNTDVKELHAKIGQLAIENDFLAVALRRIAGSNRRIPPCLDQGEARPSAVSSPGILKVGMEAVWVCLTNNIQQWIRLLWRPRLAKAGM